MNDEPSTARQKQKSSKDMLAPLQSQLTLETRDSNEGAKETDNSQHVQKLTKPTKSSRHNLETKTHIRPSSRSNVSSTFKSADINNDFQDEDIRFCVISPEKSIKPEKLSGIPRISGDGNNSVDNKSLSSAAPNSSLKSFAFDSPNTKLSSKAAHPTGWSNGTKILSTFNDQPSAAPQLAHPTGTNVSNRSNSSFELFGIFFMLLFSAPAALSSTSGLGSSLSDPKSVDASPGEVATMLGSAPFSCSSGNGNGPVPHLQSDSNMIKTEERIHRIYADRLIALTTERDQAREEVHRRDILISELRRAHEAEIKTS
uniref:SJCHGC09346 protein n=1 Tax=Schistosoma japonicum TaxID=6182 RepID=Q5DCZ4_SCHJA|nr:SJCHGC09346 protein [Schistosoma japonicum]